MIELKQMEGIRSSDRRREIFNSDIVYSVDDAGKKTKVGFIDRKPGALIAFIARLTDDEKDAIVKEVNEAREVQGRFGESGGAGMQPPKQSDVDEASAELDTDEEEDDE